MYVGSVYKYLQVFFIILRGLYCVEIEIGIGIDRSFKLR